MTSLALALLCFTGVAVAQLQGIGNGMGGGLGGLGGFGNTGNLLGGLGGGGLLGGLGNGGGLGNLLGGEGLLGQGLGLGAGIDLLGIGQGGCPGNSTVLGGLGYFAEQKCSFMSGMNGGFTPNIGGGQMGSQMSSLQQNQQRRCQCNPGFQRSFDGSRCVLPMDCAKTAITCRSFGNLMICPEVCNYQLCPLGQTCRSFGVCLGNQCQRQCLPDNTLLGLNLGLGGSGLLGSNGLGSLLGGSNGGLGGILGGSGLGNILGGSGLGNILGGSSGMGGISGINGMNGMTGMTGMSGMSGMSGMGGPSGFYKK